MKPEINDYVGIPWLKGGNTKQGADCWGLATLVLRDVFGINIKEYANSKATCSELRQIIETESKSNRWRQVKKPSIGDLVVVDKHIGVFVGDDRMLHAIERLQATSQIHRVRTIEKLFGKLSYYAHNSPIT